MDERKRCVYNTVSSIDISVRLFIDTICCSNNHIFSIPFIFAFIWQIAHTSVDRLIILIFRWRYFVRCWQTERIFQCLMTIPEKNVSLYMLNVIYYSFNQLQRKTINYSIYSIHFNMSKIYFPNYIHFYIKYKNKHLFNWKKRTIDNITIINTNSQFCSLWNSFMFETAIPIKNKTKLACVYVYIYTVFANEFSA